MKRTVAYFLVLFVMTGCVSAENKKERFIRDLQSIQIYGDGLLRTNHCTCSTSIFEFLNNLSIASNQQLSKDRKVRMAYVFPTNKIELNVIAVKTDPFADRNPCPFHDAKKNGPPIINDLEKTRWMSIWQRVKFLADVSGLEFDVDPDTRTIFFYIKE